MANYQIIKELALLHDKGLEQMRLNIVQWENQAPKYDLRVWKNTWPEGWTPGKGMILSNQEARILCRALEEDFLSEIDENTLEGGGNDKQPGDPTVL
ncbi:MAG: hypothetical protein II882_02360 [Lachnospiraceae bacterium]|nr:hypothetical protein [Lachnospiraceae bacterium]